VTPISPNVCSFSNFLQLSFNFLGNKMASIATLQRISRERLSSILLSPESSKVAIVDVRDDDHVGGHIRSSIHVPTSILDHRTTEIVDSLADKEIVVFHCYLSQQRGPGAALKYLRERDSKIKNRGSETPGEAENLQVKKGKEDGELKKADQGKEVDVAGTGGSAVESPNAKKQEVFVLDGGFVKWQEK
jgi:rhodanese-related sulfurtransferase